MFKSVNNAVEKVCNIFKGKVGVVNTSEPIATLVSLYKDNPKRFKLLSNNNVQELRVAEYEPRVSYSKVNFSYTIVLRDTVTNIDIKLWVRETVDLIGLCTISLRRCQIGDFGVWSEDDSAGVSPISEILNSRVQRYNKVVEWKRNSWNREYERQNEQERLKLLGVYGIK